MQMESIHHLHLLTFNMDTLNIHQLRVQFNFLGSLHHILHKYNHELKYILLSLPFMMLYIICNVLGVDQLITNQVQQDSF